MAYIGRVRQLQQSLSDGQFSTVQPQPAEVLARLAELETLQLECNQRNYKFVATRDVVRADVDNMIDSQCACVNAIANGDVTVIVQSGFELSKVREPRPVPATGMMKTVTPLTDAQALIIFLAIRFRDFYELEITGPAGFIRIVAGTHPKMKVSDLPVGVVLSARVRAVNSNGPGEWSSSIDFMAFKKPQNNPNS